MTPEQLYQHVIRNMWGADNETLREMRKALFTCKTQTIGQAYELSQLRVRLEDIMLQKGAL